MLEKHKNQIPEKHIFMYCEKMNEMAFTQLSREYKLRNLLKTELEEWKSLPFDGNYTEEYKGFMDNYFDNVYKIREKEFYNKCIVVCDKNNEIIGTCFLWKFHEKINTVHWLKIKKEYEGKGIGRALFTNVVENIDNNDLPIFLHTQPESYRAIKLYSDFGFKIAMNNKIGNRINNINDSIEYLKKNIPKKYFDKIGYINIPEKYLKIIEDNNINDF